MPPNFQPESRITRPQPPQQQRLSNVLYEYELCELNYFALFSDKRPTINIESHPKSRFGILDLE